MFKTKSITTAIALGTALLVLGGCASSAPAAAPAPAKATEVKVFKGLGETSVFRVGPGKDKDDGQVYSVTIATADTLFDQDGKILHVNFDSLEIVSPNDVDHPGVPMFSGWPGQPGYLKAAAATPENGVKEVSAWQTKRERGDKAYGMNLTVQLGNFQKFFKGKTVAELEQWFAKNTSDLNGRPLTGKMTDPKDKEKLAKLSDAEKKVLTDVTSGATISLKDAHGDYIGALKKSFANKVEVTIPVK